MLVNDSLSMRSKSDARDLLHLRRSFRLIAAAWTVAIVGGLSWDLQHDRQFTRDLAREGAATALDKDVLYRRWNSRHGGVYVPVTKDTPSNPWLWTVPEHDIKTPSGRLLTLVNHAYMIRQVYEMDPNGEQGRLVAFHPLDVKNAPDAWETAALRSFSDHQSEFSAVVEMHGRRYFRLLRPVVLGASCVSCHAAQGFRQGDLYGGMGVAVPMAPYEAEARRAMLATSAVYAVFWTLGLAGILLAWRPLRDLTVERQRNVAALSDALSAKEVLFREVHHRTKNNLQIVASLLNMQGGALPEAAQRALDDSQRRVRSMALLHEQLYRREQPAQVDFAKYVDDLTAELMRAYSVDPEAVQVRLDVEPVVLDADQATPCGLILNELATNCLKYAFPEGRKGEIRVALQERDGQITMRVSDTGVGLPSGFDWRNSNSMGLRIVDILTTQLNGTLTCAQDGAADFTLTFQKV